MRANFFEQISAFFADISAPNVFGFNLLLRDKALCESFSHIACSNETYLFANAG